MGKTDDASQQETELREFVRESEEQKIKFEFAPVKFNKDTSVLTKIEPSSSTSKEDVKPSKEQLDIKPKIKKEPKECKLT
jgi:hypothetical protein